LPAAALQFSLRSPLVDSTVVGVSSPERVAQTLGYAEWDIPGALWARLEELVPSSQNWLG
jgi:D-threo-aldose 1-dehydrogenase